jgi:hypothetical protein
MSAMQMRANEKSSCLSQPMASEVKKVETEANALADQWSGRHALNVEIMGSNPIQGTERLAL